MKRGENLRKHGLSGTPEHRSWCWMMTRCYWCKPGYRNYDIYRGAGITVCERWHTFENFLADMGPKPSPRHSLDRFPNAAGNYEPENCRWATAKQQARNWKDRNVLYEHGGEALTLSEWAERLGLRRESLRDRILSGWPVDRALKAASAKIAKIPLALSRHIARVYRPAEGPAPTTVAEAERLGYVAVGLIVDPEHCRRYIPDLFVREDGMCWARFPMPESPASLRKGKST